MPVQNSKSFIPSAPFQIKCLSLPINCLCFKCFIWNDGCGMIHLFSCVIKMCTKRLRLRIMKLSFPGARVLWLELSLSIQSSQVALSTAAGGYAFHTFVVVIYSCSLAAATISQWHSSIKQFNHWCIGSRIPSKSTSVHLSTSAGTSAGTSFSFLHFPCLAKVTVFLFLTFPWPRIRGSHKFNSLSIRFGSFFPSRLTESHIYAGDPEPNNLNHRSVILAFIISRTTISRDRQYVFDFRFRL